MFVAMANRVLLSFLVILASVAVGQAERVQRLRSNSEAVLLMNEDIADRRRGDGSDRQQNLSEVEDFRNPPEIYRAQNKIDGKRTAIDGEQQFEQGRRILDQQRSDNNVRCRDDPNTDDLSRNDRRRCTDDEKVSPIEASRRDPYKETIMESRRIYENIEKIPTRELKRMQDEELINKRKKLRKNDSKRLINESTKERRPYLDDTVSPMQERGLSQKDMLASRTRSVLSNKRQPKAMRQGDSNDEYSVHNQSGHDTPRPSRQGENRVYVNDDGRTNRPTTANENSGDNAQNKEHDYHDPQVIQVLRRVSLQPEQKESLNHDQQQRNLRRNHKVAKSQLEIRRQDSPIKKPEFERTNSRKNGNSLETGESRPHNDREIKYEARMASEEIRSENNPNSESGLRRDTRRKKKTQPEIYVPKEEELNGRREQIRSNLNKFNNQQSRSDPLKNYNNSLGTKDSASAHRSNAVRNLEIKNAQRHIVEQVPGKIPLNELQSRDQQKRLIPHADPQFNSISNLRPLPNVRLSSSKHRTAQPSKNRRVHKEENVPQSIKVPSFQLKPPGLREPSNHISHSVPFKKTTQQSGNAHIERKPVRPISSPSKNTLKKKTHQSGGSASGRSKKPYRDQSAEGGQQVAQVAHKPLSTAATDKGHGEDKNKGKGHHKSHKSSHKKAEGHKGDKGHQKEKSHKKIHKGDYDKEHKKGHHDKGGVFHEEDHHDEHHNGDYEKRMKGIKGYKKGKKMHHHKGHNDKGFKATHHVKEYSVNKKHYEDVDDKEYQGEHDHFDKFFDDFKKGMFEAVSFKGDKHHEQHGKKGHHKKGHHDHQDKGHDKHYDHDGHHDHHEKHGHEKGHHEKHGHDDHGHR